MRISCAFGVLALALLPIAARAQSPPAAVPAAAPEGDGLRTTSENVLDFGVRGTSLAGEGSRYERYRDLGDGVFLETARFSREQNGWFMRFDGTHVGRRDQRIKATFVKPGTFKAYGMWDQIPMLLSRTTQSLFVETSPGVLKVPDLIQQQMQVAASAAVTSTMATMVAQFDRPFELRTRRFIGQGGAEYQARPDLTLRVDVRNIDREGHIPFGGSFGHSSFVETPAPIQYNQTDVDGSAEYAHGNALVRGGYSVSRFHNEVTSLLFDNPYKSIDATNASSTGRLALPPSNSWMNVNGMFSYRLPYHSRATAYVSTGSLKDAGDPIIPFTSNTVLGTPAIPLNRPTVDGSARTKNVNLNFTSRPVKPVNVTLRYKYFDYDNQTPIFDLTDKVTYDASKGTNNPAAETEPFGVLRQTFDADVSYSPTGRLTGGAGFSRLTEERTHRIFESTTDNVSRVRFDAVGTEWVTVRTKYEHAERRGTGIAEGILELQSIGEQPGMRHFDVADRDRDRVTLLGVITPVTNVSANLSVAAGKDDFLNTTFGLLDNTHRVYSVGADATPTEQVTMGISYAYEDYRALSRSRQASSAQFNDVTRNWSTTGHDRVHSVVASADVAKILGKVDIRLAYDLSRARSTYVYGVGPIADRTLPEETDVVASTLPAPTQLPPTFSETQRASLDATYALTDRLDLGISCWYDRYRVEDFTLDTTNSALARGSALLLGYFYQPYTAKTFWGRIVVHW